MKISMADITNKSIMHREAVAFGKISLKEETIKKIKSNPTSECKISSNR